MSAYLMVSLQSHSFYLAGTKVVDRLNCEVNKIFEEHPRWDKGIGWKSKINNLRLVIEPYISLNKIKQWLGVFNIQQLSEGFLKLQRFMNIFQGYILIESG